FKYGFSIEEDHMEIFNPTGEVRIEGVWYLLARPKDLCEDRLNEMDLVHTVTAFRHEGHDYQMYKDYSGTEEYALSITESILSALESEIFWENPFIIKGEDKEFAPEDWWENFTETEKKTFNIDNTFLFYRDEE